MSKNIRIGVAGAGVFGSFHAAKYAAHSLAELTAIYDTDQRRAGLLAAKYQAEPHDDYVQFLNAVDAVIIATPASAHFALAKSALDQSKHVFVEKPLSPDVAEARALVSLAQANGLIMQVGHQERYVCEAVGLLRPGAALHRIECVRRVPFSGRCDDVSAALDLMVHDIDIIRHITASPLANVRAEGGVDDIAAELVLESGVVVSLIASRRSQTSERRMTLYRNDGIVEFDFIRRKLTDSTPSNRNAVFAAGEGGLALTDPLAHSADIFVEALINGDSCGVSGLDGLAAVEWARKIEVAAGLSQLQADYRKGRLRA